MGALGFILNAEEGERSWRLADYVRRGGYRALKKIINEKIPADQIVGRDIVEARGGVVIRVKVEEGHSTTNVIKKLKG